MLRKLADDYLRRSADRRRAVAYCSLGALVWIWIVFLSWPTLLALGDWLTK